MLEGPVAVYGLEHGATQPASCAAMPGLRPAFRVGLAAVGRNAAKLLRDVHRTLVSAQGERSVVASGVASRGSCWRIGPMVYGNVEPLSVGSKMFPSPLAKLRLLD